MSSNGSSWNLASSLAGTHTITAGADYWVNLKFTGSQYILSYSLDGEEFIDDITLESEAVMAGGGTPVIGYGWTSSPLTSGYVDLNESYVKIADEIVWKGTTRYNTYKNENGHEFYKPESKEVIDEIYNKQGIAWYYGIDEENQIIHLPRNDYYFKGCKDGVGQFVDAGLPNITGKLGVIGLSGATYTGAFYYAGGGAALSNSGEGDYIAGFDASLSNSIYGNSDTVQPPSVNVIYYMIVGGIDTELSHINIVEQVENGIAEIEEVKQDSIDNISSLTIDGLSQIKEDLQTSTSSIMNTRDNSITQIQEETTELIEEAEKWAIGSIEEREEGSSKYWAEVAKEIISLQIGDIGQAIFPIDESKGLRRYLNGSILLMNENNTKFIEKLKETAALYPSIICTEEQWQNIANNSHVGQCGKFAWIEEGTGEYETLETKRATWADNTPIIIGEDGSINVNILTVGGVEIPSTAFELEEGYYLLAYDEEWTAEPITELPKEMTLAEIIDEATSGSMLADQYYAKCTDDGYLYTVVPAASYTKEETAWLVTDAEGNVYNDLTNIIVKNEIMEVTSVRLPRIVMPIQNLLNLSNLGDIVEAGVPNITGHTNAEESYIGGAFYSEGNRAGGCNNGSNGYWGVAFDASRSSAVYGNSDTVQQEQIQYPYFIQIATKYEQVDITNEIEINNPYFFGMSQYFDNEPNNTSWLKSTGQWNSKDVYPDYYNWLLSEYNNPTYFHKKGNVSLVGNVQDNDGVLSNFSTSNYAQLPSQINLGSNFEIVLKITTGETINTTQYFIGNANCFQIYLSDSLFTLDIGDGTVWTTAATQGIHAVSSNTTYYLKLTFDGSVYKLFISTDGDSYVEDISVEDSTLLPSHIFAIGYTLGSTSALSFEGSIDLNECYINKSGQRVWSGSYLEGIKTSEEEYTDYDYVLNLEEEKFRLPLLDGSESLPSNKNISLTLLASSSSYIAPVNGWVNFSKQGSDNQTIILFNATTGTRVQSYLSTTSTSNWTGIQLEVKRGDIFKAEYTTTGDTKSFKINQATGNGSLYYYIGETIQNSKLVDVGRIQEKFVDKADRDLSNCTRPYIIETYKSGYAWYRIWSDGWIEQGSSVYISSNGQKVTMLKSFKDSTYTLATTGYTSEFGNVVCHTRTVNSFNVYTADDSSFNAGGINYIACGY